MQYQKEGVPLIVVAGKEYGTGSSRDWAAKGTTLLGVKAVIAESFERIHRSNLIGMNVLPLQFKPGESRVTLRLDGSELFEIEGVTTLKPRSELTVNVQRKDGSRQSFKVDCRVDTEVELEYFKHGGVLQYVIRKLL
jgi:aconitate hydratase